MFKNLFNEPNTLIIILVVVLTLVLLQYITVRILRRFGKDPKYLINKSEIKKVSTPIFILFLGILCGLKIIHEYLDITELSFVLGKISTLLIIISITWLIIVTLKVIKRKVISKYDVNASNNLKARQVYTQFNILERIIIFIIIILAIGIALMSFDSIKEIGVSIFASAGVAGIVIGFSAQKMIGSILAGIQIAIAQPIKMDDVVIVEGEWGRIEEITLTYVVVNIWDKRRLILPTTYFIEQPFQNWTKTSSDILGTVFLHTDYNVPFDELRKELTRVLESTDLWDGKVNVLQVTDSLAQSVEIRALMSAKDSPTAWDLRVLVREKLITFLQENYPESIARTRVVLKNNEQTK
ncbi:mechanosensitive ion channel family protein [Cellulophaga baltica]|uniref:mechanosensitive ion channel family protein n=1 Tax=Cellulophaga TaxID=104264 RepID=UPI001C06ECB9|nr:MULTISPECIES: mechanosensitive ion channel domain-containing protein [Cellulophaga]MBU2997616.1 mechanosensitive ion channel family protein [Cellulophaga baltica]MDO6769011.1 mechanosensitive ion channel [Cellulophaga sp. 1_MG-2023]